MKKNILIFIIIILSVLVVHNFISIFEYKARIKSLSTEIFSLKEDNSKLIFKNKELSEKNHLKSKFTIIEEETQKCMQNCNYTTACMNECVLNSGEKWDYEINKNIEFLKKNLSNYQYELLKDTQTKWADYKDAQQLFNLKILENKDGTIYTNILTGMQVDIIEHRAKELRSLYSLFSE